MTNATPQAHGFTLHHEVEPRSGDYRWIYIWHWPIRAMHWVAALSILVLAVTGLYIGRPYFAPAPGPTTPYLMGWIRFIHFAAAATLVATAIIRAYWLFAGNKFERLAALFPVRHVPNQAGIGRLSSGPGHHGERRRRACRQEDSLPAPHSRGSHDRQ